LKPASEKRSTVRPPGAVGTFSLLLIAALLFGSCVWLRADRRFVGAATMTAAVRAVLAYGVVEPSPEEVFQAAANGLTSVLDPFSAFMPPAEYGWFTEETEGEYVGIGVEIKRTEGEIVIVHVFPQSAAADAMLRPGDRIVAIDSVPTAGVPLAAVVEKMRGPVDAPVAITLESPGGEGRTVTLVRRSVAVTPFPVSGLSVSGVAYVRWSEFSLGSADRLAALVEDFSIQSPIGLVIDLRGNPGGVLDEAVSAAGIFLAPNSLVCQLAGRGGADRSNYATASAPSTYAGPLVLLLDETSASASEVFAAALQEAGRAVIVGRRSFGKGWVQTIFPYDDEGGLRLSTGRYYTPGGRTLGDPHLAVQLLEAEGDRALTGAGLEPDMEVPRVEAGGWEQTLARDGIFGDFATAFGDDWPATGPEDTDDLLEELRRWCDSLAIEPDGPALTLLDGWQRATRRGEHPVSADTLAVLAGLLTAARGEDAALLFERERSRLLLRMWEQRILAVGRPDEGELEALFDVDPALSAARDLLEEPERYRALVASRQGHAAGPAVSGG